MVIRTTLDLMASTLEVAMQFSCNNSIRRSIFEVYDDGDDDG